MNRYTSFFSFAYNKSYFPLNIFIIAVKIAQKIGYDFSDHGLHQIRIELLKDALGGMEYWEKLATEKPDAETKGLKI
jgi:hypothetical protein